MKNRLFYGDNLDVLRRYIETESVDLVYLDPPFNSNANYNVLFAEKSGTRSAAQIQAFEDTWQWDESAAAAFREVVEAGGPVSQALQAFRTFLGDSDMLAYLAMMAPRLVELRRALKPTGSLYLHCDQTASHYLKMLLDATFGPEQFLSEIIWKRTGSHNSARRFGPVHDTILYYGKTDAATWNQQLQAYDDGYLSHFKKIDAKTGLAFQDVALTGPGVRTGPSGKPWRGHDPTPKGRHWQPASYLYTKYAAMTGDDLARYDLLERFDKLDEVGLIYWGSRGGLPRYKQFLTDAPGAPIADVWTDIDVINSQAQERLGYPTQKPEALLDRIIAASSNEGDVVLDPFCGCGTTIAAAQKLKRQWIGIDITHLAIGLIKKRLSDAHGEGVKDTYEVIGEPTSVEGAKSLAASEPFQFQTWALGLVGARPAGPEQAKKGKDRGIDGRIYFHDGTGKTQSIILSVKAGHTGPDHVRDLRGTIEREKAVIGVLITMDEHTREMRKEAASGEFYLSDWGQHAKIQLLTVGELLTGKNISRPPDRQTSATYKRAPKVEPDAGEAGSMGWGKSTKPSKRKRR